MEQLGLPTGPARPAPSVDAHADGDRFLIPYALRNGQLVHVDSVESGAACGCVCPGLKCGAPMVARKGTVRRHHFAHATGKGCGESAMHRVAKFLLTDRLTAGLKTRTPVSYRWRCGSCGIFHTRDLLHRAQDVAMERSLGPCQPDVQVLGEGSHPLVFLEVVVTHAPEPAVLETARSLKAAVAQIRLTQPDDLEALRVPHTLTGNLDIACPLEQCHCRKCPLYPRELVLYPMACPTCKKTMKAAMVVDHRASFFAVRFLMPEIQYAKSQGWTSSGRSTPAPRRRTPGSSVPTAGPPRSRRRSTRGSRPPIGAPTRSRTGLRDSAWPAG